MVLQKMGGSEATFQDQISAGIQQALDKMEELQISTTSVAQAYEELNKAQGYTSKAPTRQRSSSCLQAQSQNLGTTIRRRLICFQMSMQSKQTATSLRKAKIEETFSDEVSARIQTRLIRWSSLAPQQEVEKATRLLNEHKRTGSRHSWRTNVLRGHWP